LRYKYELCCGVVHTLLGHRSCLKSLGLPLPVFKHYEQVTFS